MPAQKNVILIKSKREVDEFGNVQWVYSSPNSRQTKLHRDDGPAVEYATGSKYWYFNNKLHRIDGPAVIQSNGDKEWWVHGDLHRTDGPAVEYADGEGIWCFKGKQYHSVDEFCKAAKLNDEEKTLLLLKYN